MKATRNELLALKQDMRINGDELKRLKQTYNDCLQKLENELVHLHLSMSIEDGSLSFLIDNLLSERRAMQLELKQRAESADIM